MKKQTVEKKGAARMVKFKEISLMNAFLCLCVVMVHLTAEAIGVWVPGTFKYTAVFIPNRLLCFSVPAFLFLSGLKLYNKYDGEKVRLKEFYVGRLTKIVVPYVVAALMYFLYMWINNWAQLKYLPGYIFLGTTAAHCYYIVIAVQLYLLFPFLKTIFGRFPKTVGAVSLVISALLAHFEPFAYCDRFAGTYLFYFVLGMLASHYNLSERLRGKGIYAASAVCFAVTAVVHMSFLYMEALGYEYYYGELMKILYVFCSIVFLYGTFQRLGDRFGWLMSIAQVLNETSYSIYLYHILVLYLLRSEIFHYLKLTVWDRLAISTVVLYALVFAYSYGVHYIKGRMKNRAGEQIGGRTL